MGLQIGVLKEPVPERRVAILPEHIKAFNALGVSVCLESNAGLAAGYNDEAYIQAGAIVSERSYVIVSPIILCFNPIDPGEAALLPKGVVMIGMLKKQGEEDSLQALAQIGAIAFAMSAIPRTTRAQAMDVLSSMANIAGYKAVLLAATHLPRYFPMLTTAAGTISPAKVLIIGAGVAGLQAIATAKRLGAVVHAFDTRSSVKEQVMSLGGKFVEVEGASESAAAGGYAIEQSDEFKARQAQKIHEVAIQSDVIITTAQIPGRQAPLLIHEATIEAMKPGSVIVDLAASSGGNCAFTQQDQTVVHRGITIIGDSNLAGSLPQDASRLYGKNLLNFLKLLLKDGNLILNFEDDIVKATCVAYDGKVIG